MYLVSLDPAGPYPEFVKTRSEYGLATSRHECDEILRCVSTGVFTISHRFHGYTSAYTYSNIALDCEL